MDVIDSPATQLGLRPIAVGPREAAALIGRTEATLRHWRTNGRGPAFGRTDDGAGSAIFYRLSDLEAWLEERVAAASERVR